MGGSIVYGTVFISSYGVIHYMLFDFVGSIFGYILWFFFDLFDNYCLAVVCFTLLFKILFFPLDIKSRVTAFKSAKLFSKQAEIKKMYKNDMQKQAEEISKLYENEGLSSSAGSLLQSVFQMVSMLGVYCAIVRPLTNMFHFSKEKVAAAIAKLTQVVGINANITKNYEQLNVVKYFPSNMGIFDMFNDSEVSDILDFNKGFNFLGIDFSITPKSCSIFNVVWLFPLFCVLTSILSTVINQKANKINNALGCMKYLPYVVLIPYMFFIINTPVAVGFYYIIFNVLTIIQSLIISKFFNPANIVAKEQAARITRLLNEEKDIPKK